jgi:hypothetical protein
LGRELKILIKDEFQRIAISGEIRSVNYMPHDPREAEFLGVSKAPSLIRRQLAPNVGFYGNAKPN